MLPFRLKVAPHHASIFELGPVLPDGRGYGSTLASAVFGIGHQCQRGRLATHFGNGYWLGATTGSGGDSGNGAGPGCPGSVTGVDGTFGGDGWEATGATANTVGSPPPPQPPKVENARLSVLDSIKRRRFTDQFQLLNGYQRGTMPHTGWLSKPEASPGKFDADATRCHAVDAPTAPWSTADAIAGRRLPQ